MLPRASVVVLGIFSALASLHIARSMHQIDAPRIASNAMVGIAIAKLLLCFVYYRAYAGASAIFIACFAAFSVLDLSFLFDLLTLPAPLAALRYTPIGDFLRISTGLAVIIAASNAVRFRGSRARHAA